jgi:hypothetical protein
MNVDIEGQRVENDFDIVAQAGNPRTALVKTYETNVEDGVLRSICEQ